MRLLKGQRWICEYRYCGSEILVVEPSHVEEGMHPRCSCGGMMKRKIEAKPQATITRQSVAGTASRRRTANGAT